MGEVRGRRLGVAVPVAGEERDVDIDVDEGCDLETRRGALTGIFFGGVEGVTAAGARLGCEEEGVAGAAAGECEGDSEGECDERDIASDGELEKEKRSEKKVAKSGRRWDFISPVLGRTGAVA